MGLEGDRHRTQLRARRASHRARHRVRAAAEEAAARSRRAAGRCRPSVDRRRAARPHDRVRVLRSGRREAPLRRAARQAERRGRRARWRPRRAGVGQRRVRPGALRRRDRLPARRVPRARTQSERRRADDVRAGQQRALPPQDLQRELHDRRPGRDAVDVRDDPRHPRARAAAHGRRVQRQRVGDGRRRRAALASRGLHQRAALLGPRRAHARADEGRDAQPSDGDLAVSRRVDRRRWRDPRRGRDRPRLEAEGGAHRLHGLEPASATARRRRCDRRAVGARALRKARAHRERAADHDRRPARRCRVQQRVRAPEPRRLLPRLRADRRGPASRLSQADHDRGRPRLDRRVADAQDRVPGRHAPDPARRARHAHRHGRRRGELDGRRRECRRARLRFGAARQPRDPATRAGGHQPLRGARRLEPDPRHPRRRRGRHLERLPRARRRGRPRGALRSLEGAGRGERPRTEGDLVQREPGALRDGRGVGRAAAVRRDVRARALPVRGRRRRDRAARARRRRPSPQPSPASGSGSARDRHADGRAARQAAEDASRRAPRARRDAGARSRRRRARARRLRRPAPSDRRQQALPDLDRRPHRRRPEQPRSDGRAVAGAGRGLRRHARRLRRLPRRGDVDGRAHAARRARCARVGPDGGRRSDHESSVGADRARSRQAELQLDGGVQRRSCSSGRRRGALRHRARDERAVHRARHQRAGRQGQPLDAHALARRQRHGEAGDRAGEPRRQRPSRRSTTCAPRRRRS